MSKERIAQALRQAHPGTFGSTTAAALTVIVGTMFETIANDVAAGEAVQLAGFGTFRVKERAARKGRNPQTGEEIDVPASKTVGFKPAKKLRDRL